MDNRKEENKKVILSIDNLKKYFISQGYINKAVDGVSFDLHEGEIIGLIGESGSGKTTVGRTILRLYDEYNGFVRLEDKIISGKKISSQLNKFLRKNVQMIFQDPHASLNGQQNIYTILKEPLVVNGILKSKISDIFKDWLEVKKAFKYSFQIQAMQLELQNLIEINSLAKPLFNKWVKEFQEMKFDTDLSKEDNFTLFFGYLEERQNVESLIINQMYSNTSQLIDYYYQMQKRYRNDELEKVELDYTRAKELIRKEIMLSKVSVKEIKAREELKKLKDELKELKQSLKELRNENINTFVNFINENKREASLINISRLMATDLDFYSYNLKNELLYLKKAKILKHIKSLCPYIRFEEVREISNKLNQYSKEFYSKHLQDLKFSKDLKQKIHGLLENEFKFSFDKHKKSSNQEKTNWDKLFAKKTAKIDEVKQSMLIKEAPKNTKDDLVKFFEKTKTVEEKYEIARSKMLVSYKEKIKDLYDKINKQNAIYQDLVNKQTFCNKKYEFFKEEFFKYVNLLEKEKIDAAKAKIASLSATKEDIKKNAQAIKAANDLIKRYEKDLSLSLKMYESDISLKEETLKSFDIEKKYLKRDIKSIYVLLGIDLKWVEQNIQVSSKDSKWKERYNFFDSIFAFPIAKLLISDLLSKIIIYKSLEDVGLLKQFAYRYPHEFSGGQLQRIVIARALITEPKVIVADEPIASLDISIQAQVVNLLKELCLKKNIGLIFIAHDLSMIEYIADKVEIMHLGKIVEKGKTESIYSNPVHPYTINLFKAIPKISNVNEKFENVSFALDYLDAQQFPNIPEIFKVEEDHYIYGTKEQVKEWMDSSYKRKY
ncbi:peptide ABC transporter ATP-binding protein [[Mycoplasma] phocae]|uniref:Peptide ABC transporter ATP-binding protein n=1 Tax=[Mycoplasma] phocae TaxID=142651 RepID=A0A2Z5IPM7_9BACT|nr:ATP-binding cassette domain-containing protein [[Mycoplasma] phocae]AXE60649.1 peptide ABC transporter ATP-binding protein [[Mycoplasma] phocae]